MSRESDFEACRVRCPFYRGSSGREHYIRCEGIRGAQSIRINYSGRERQRVRRLETFCQNCYEKCEIYQAIDRSKY